MKKQAAADTATERGRPFEVTGEVISNKMNKTISVLIYRLVKHKKYGKYMRRTSVFKAHDENNTAKIGDTVKIVHTRPLSKTKRWKLVEVVKQAAQTEGADV
ncbi:MAG: 30S ribosomal protein S17 [Bdellovibrionota bacterium]